ncbi:hypothetical protein Tsubulata_048254 [Turnera subulata]|uniref:Uncharacterized protein n=1 Tax=Turnera subulata TaxID=218843 RepID=A0A9Q0JL19_9ROSI|nr:hypothetical protein Tsubulata_048254 [Turnera subulata]
MLMIIYADTFISQIYRRPYTQKAFMIPIITCPGQVTVPSNVSKRQKSIENHLEQLKREKVGTNKQRIQLTSTLFKRRI